DAKDWNTPLMQLTRLIHDATTLDEKKHLRQQLHQLLDQYWQRIDFTESNLNGDTLLHFVIWCGEYEIAIDILPALKDEDSYGAQATCA
ncbi:MAG: hypothetical protein EBT92_19235, partial [Planctomycetes bacterium]|nr:hypothetical protein [Planctomycetota bacterium]